MSLLKTPLMPKYTFFGHSSVMTKNLRKSIFFSYLLIQTKNVSVFNDNPEKSALKIHIFFCKIIIKNNIQQYYIVVSTYLIYGISQCISKYFFG